MTDYIQVLTTVNSEDASNRIATRLLERRLAACVQVSGPVKSSYWWKGQIETATEWYCIAKTTAARYRDVEAAITSEHPYDEPEIVAIPIPAGSEGYLRWIGEQVEGAGASG